LPKEEFLVGILPWYYVTAYKEEDAVHKIRKKLKKMIGHVV
jgi:hypothetical protein